MANNYMRIMRLNIFKSHDEYLREGKSPSKIKFREILEGYINKFVTLVPHKEKFTHPKFAEALRLSVQKSNEFSASDAVSAWLAISTYASNLITEPWRTEYREIRLYSGYFTHHVKKHLYGAEALLELIGYQFVEKSRMVLLGPPNLDDLTDTSLNALIAMCECQVLFTIYREVVKHLPNITYSDILLFRETYVCSEESAIRCILSSQCAPVSYCAECVYPYSVYPSNCCRKCVHPSYYSNESWDCVDRSDRYLVDTFDQLNISPQSEYSSSYDELDACKSNDKKPTEVSMSKSNRSKKNTTKSAKKNNEGSLWECSKCTYRNTAIRDVCEMCSRSKNFINEVPLISGGKQCPKCTLVNQKTATQCAACRGDLSECFHYV